jgi:hypothetical protein
MNSPRCLEIAERMNLLLKRELGEGVDALRLMRDALYARDVLLVCAAHRNAELPQLARAWREALAEAEPAATATGTRLAKRVFSDSALDAGYGSSRFGPDQPGFFHSQAGGLGVHSQAGAPAATASGFGDSTMRPMPTIARRPAWYSPARWFGSR